MRTRLLWGVLLLSMVGVIAASAWEWFAAANPPVSALRPFTVAPMATVVPPFQLVDETGRPFESGALKGRVWIADFIFTSCAGSCPLITGKMRSLQEKLPGSVWLVSISVDPRRDRPSVLAEYARRAGAQPGRWHFLTGSDDAIRSLIQEGFRLSVAEGDSPEEPITHSVRFALVDREGKIRDTYDSTDPKAVERLIQEAAQLVR